MEILNNLSKYQIYLASKSPRRQELMHMLRIPFTVVTISGIDESYPDNMNGLKVPEYLSSKKAKIYTEKLSGNELVITADTLVICNNTILGKPKDKEDAKKMLKLLSDVTHQVATGVTISTKDKCHSFTSITDVTFSQLSDEEIDYYVENFSPLDKAGAYGIQEWIGAVAVSSINGSFYNVMGLPVHQLYKELRKF